VIDDGRVAVIADVDGTNNIGGTGDIGDIVSVSLFPVSRSLSLSLSLSRSFVCNNLFLSDNCLNALCVI
jgi:hypothetical protein